jgi:hypothetical protein
LIPRAAGQQLTRKKEEEKCPRTHNSTKQTRRRIEKEKTSAHPLMFFFPINQPTNPPDRLNIPA